MGSLLFDFLTESPLFDERQLDDQFSRLPDSELDHVLQSYRQYCLENLGSLEAEIPPSPSSLQAFAGSTPVSLERLKQSAFYIQTHILDDPLFRIGARDSEASATMAQYLGFSRKGIDRQELVGVVRYLKSLTPMIAADYVKLLPVSRLFEPPTEMAMQYSDVGFADVLPEPILEFMWDRSQVRSLYPAEGGWIVSEQLQPSRGIAVTYKNHPVNQPYVYHLFEMRSEFSDDDERVLQGTMSIPNEPPIPDKFNSWVFQSVNQAARAFYNETMAQVVVADRLNASFLTHSRFVYEFLQEMGAASSDIRTHTANILVKFELPFLARADVATLMSIRQTEGAAFQAFRDELDKRFLELRSEKDPDEIRLKFENAMYELSEVQLRSVERQVEGLRKKAVAEAVIAVGGLAGAISTGGWTLLPAAIAFAQGYKTFEDYNRTVRLNPSFFLWRVLRR